MSEKVINIKAMVPEVFDSYLEEIDLDNPGLSEKPTQQERRAYGAWRWKAAKWIFEHVYKDFRSEEYTPGTILQVFALTLAATFTVQQDEIKNLETSLPGSEAKVEQNTAEAAQK